MRIYIVRHGQTEENKKRIFQGHLPGELSLEGINQSRSIAKYFKDKKIDLIFSSDLKRAKDTLSEILSFKKNIPIKYLKGLRERDYGSFNGKPRREVETSIAKKEFESEKSMYQRSKEIIKKIKKSGAEDILIMAHGSINKMIITSLLKKNEQFRRSLPILQNGSISIIIQKNDSFVMDSFNYCNHLKNL